MQWRYIYNYTVLVLTGIHIKFLAIPGFCYETLDYMSSSQVVQLCLDALEILCMVVLTTRSHACSYTLEKL